MEALEVEPVHGLGNRHERAFGIARPAALRPSRVRTEPWVRQRLRELCGAAVDGEHAIEMPGQRDGGLSVAGRAIDGEPTIGREPCHVRDQLRRITGAVATVIRRLPGEVVLERRSIRTYAHRETRDATWQSAQ